MRKLTHGPQPCGVGYSFFKNIGLVDNNNAAYVGKVVPSNAASAIRVHKKMYFKTDK